MSTIDSWVTARSKYTVGRSKELRISADKKSLDAELYGLGSKIRHLQTPGGNESGIFDAFRLPPKELPTQERKRLNPPGGKASGIFDAFHLTPPKEVSTPERKVKNRFQSQVFSSPLVSPPRPVTPLKLTSHYNLFESPGPKYKVSKEESKSTKSSAFDVDDRIMLPRHYIKKNPIIGLGVKKDAEKPRSRMKTQNPITFEGMGEILRRKSRQPPGGMSSISLEYVE